MRFETTERLLDSWGSWSRNTGDRLGYKSIMGKILDMGLGTRSLKRPIYISDDVGLEIDRGIAALKSRNEQLAEAIKLYYVFGLTIHAISEYLKVHNKTASKLLVEAVSWIDAFLFCTTCKQ
ncbi:antiterminator Q family protein [Catenovulum agarivorans]|uniref:antiterminator Q family protein n=1 Tax=Catenovulum agarivorans TaxID=1172192 RepID=UPI00036A8A51|nr:antiterminator Q family protein [Catenovulum agarivorans]